MRSWCTPPLLVEGKKVLEGARVYSALWALGPLYAPVTSEPGELSQCTSLDELEFYYELRQPSARVYFSVVELVGRDVPTPMVLLKDIGGSGVRVWAKLEWYHPLSLSIKDRVAWFMLQHALEKGDLKSKLLYEATSANTGLGLVGLANYYGLKTRVYLPPTAQGYLEYVFKAMGAEVVRKSAQITVEMIDSVLEEAARNGAAVLNQFENDLNFVAHLRQTAKEVDYQLKSVGAKPAAVVCGLGTSGHASAISVYFKSKYGNVRVYGVQPRAGSFIPGTRRVETGMKWLKYAELDEVLEYSLEEAFEMVMKVAKSNGILVGPSGAAVLRAVEDLAERGELQGDVVAVIPDHGLKYAELLELVTKKLESRQS